jgi:hypothetical protein
MDCLRVELGEVAKVSGFCGSTVATVLTLNGAGAGLVSRFARSPRLLQSSFEDVHSALLDPRIVCFGGSKSAGTKHDLGLLSWI